MWQKCYSTWKNSCICTRGVLKNFHPLVLHSQYLLTLSAAKCYCFGSPMLLLWLQLLSLLLLFFVSFCYHCFAFPIFAHPCLSKGCYRFDFSMLLLWLLSESFLLLLFCFGFPIFVSSCRSKAFFFLCCYLFCFLVLFGFVLFSFVI